MVITKRHISLIHIACLNIFKPVVIFVCALQRNPSAIHEGIGQLPNIQFSFSCIAEGFGDCSAPPLAA